ncbi:MAG: response regulator transcription factor [Burkholderiales bacterium]|nr:response regulator transcription factor [Burkholderiales bacterium]
MKAQLLLVEDDTAIADMVQLHLAEAGFVVHRESDSRGALRVIGSRDWDLVLLDLTLPGGDGWDICRQLRQRSERLPVIIVSARSSEAHRVLGLELGADDYLVKPFSMLELVARVRALLRRAQRQPPPHDALHFNGLQFDPVRREVVQGQARTPLTLRESDLLGFLARHPGQVFSRAELLDKVWGHGFDGYEHTVNSHINRLRQKIEADPQEPRWIQTVWGVGYRFDAGAARAAPDPPP